MSTIKNDPAAIPYSPEVEKLFLFFIQQQAIANSLVCALAMECMCQEPYTGIPDKEKCSACEALERAAKLVEKGV